jgi:putative flippase GtrA
MSSEKVCDNNITAGKTGLWRKFKDKHPELAQFLVFFMLSNGITVLQMALMPMIKGAFGHTTLVDTNFQILQVGRNFDGSPYYVFNYAAGSIADGGGGGLAYFLAVQITLAIAQIINFFAQRNITFKSSSNIWKAAFWYVVAYIFISIGAAALQGLYKAPIYNLFMNTWGMGSVGVTIADFITMIINSAISFWVFFPIFKVIFKEHSEK